MPRLIRMISDKNSGHFDNTFDDEIVLPPYSKMKLQDLQATLPPTSITIDSSNQLIKFHLDDPTTDTTFGEITTYLPTGAYSGEGSAKSFAKQMENTLNGSLSTNKGGGSYVIPVLAGRAGGIKECGGEWNVGITEPGSTTDRDLPFIEYNIQDNFNLKPSITTGATTKIIEGQGFTNENLHDIEFLTEAPISTYYAKIADESNADPEAYIFGDKFLARGGGVFSTYIRNIGKTIGPTSEQGFVMGFCVEDPKTFLKPGENAFDRTKIMYGIQVSSVSGVYKIQNGIGYNLPANKLGDEFEITGNWDDDDEDLSKKPQLQFGFGQRIDPTPSSSADTKSVLNFRLFKPTTQGSGAGNMLSKISTGWNRFDKNSSGNYVDSGSDDFTNHWNTTDLYPVVAFWSKKVSSELELILANLNFTSSPSLDALSTRTGLLAHGLSPSPSSLAQVYFDFPNEVLDFFNMGERLPTLLSPHDYTNSFKFTGFSNITSDINPETFVLELMTYQLDSYDGKTLTTNEDGNPIQKGKGKRVSILATIPRNPAFNNRTLLYEGANPYYIDLNNENPILMRQLFLRLLDFDLEPVVMRGRGSLTLLIK